MFIAATARCLAHAVEELRDLHFEPRRDLLERFEGDISLPSLHRATEGVMQACLLAQALLGEPSQLPQHADAVTELFSKLRHDQDAATFPLTGSPSSVGGIRM